MLRPSKRKDAKKEVPEWKRQLEEPASSGPSSSAREPEPAVVAPAVVVPAAATDGAGTAESFVDDDDDDDDDFDPSNYDLDAPGGDGPPAEEEVDDSPSGTPACRVVVANLAFESTHAAMTAFFTPCGKIENIEMPDLSKNKRTACAAAAIDARAHTSDRTHSWRASPKCTQLSRPALPDPPRHRIVTFARESGAQAALLLSGRHLPVDRPSAQIRKLTILLAPLGATPQDGTSACRNFPLGPRMSPYDAREGRVRNFVCHPHHTHAHACPTPNLRRWLEV